jgi:DNA invertase Pin-like site-specific DNA recombinase
VILGRPVGSKTMPENHKLYTKREKISELLKKNKSFSAIGRILKVHRITVGKYIRGSEYFLDVYTEKNKRNLHN